MRIMKFAVALVAGSLLFGASLGWAQGESAKTVERSLSAFKALANAPKKSIPPALMKDVQGIAIFPGVAKTDLMTSDRVGRGVLLVRDAKGNWSSPVLVNLSGGTLGWQVVGDPMDIYLLFKNARDVESLLKQKFSLSGKKASIAGPVGATLKGATDQELKAEINSYVFSRGEHYDVTVATAALQVSGANDAFYGAKKVRAEDIVSGQVAKPSPEIAELRKLLADYAAKK